MTLARSIKAAHGVFAPGHLGELTRFCPFELVDDILDRSGRRERRLRALPSRVGVYFVLALCLFPAVGYRRVWEKLTAGLRGLPLPSPTEKALRDLRKRIGIRPLLQLFDTLAVPLAAPQTRGVAYRHWRTVALDGCTSIKAPDRTGVRRWLIAAQDLLGLPGYPLVQLIVLCETGTRGLLTAVIDSTERGETTLARRLLNRLDSSILLLADRDFIGAAFLAAVRATGAHYLVRCRADVHLPRLAVLDDGSFLSQRGDQHIRVIEARLTMHCADGTRVSDTYRLVTTLTNPRTDPTDRLVRLYHERWEVETSFYSLRHTLLSRHVLRSEDPTGIVQEMWALLVVYQLLRMAMIEAMATRPERDVDRAGFTACLEAARNQVINADGILPQDDDTDPGVIGRTVVEHLLPTRRHHTRSRTLKAAHSRYYRRRPEDNLPATSSNITNIEIAVDAPIKRPTPDELAAILTQPTRRERVQAVLSLDPRLSWHARHIADLLDEDDYNNFCVWMSYHACQGRFHKAGRAIYQLAPLTDASPP